MRSFFDNLRAADGLNMTQLGVMLSKLTEPSVEITAPHERRRARLVSSFIVIAFPLGAVLLTLYLWEHYHGLSLVDILIQLSSLLGLGACYFISRTYRYRYSVILFCALYTFGTWDVVWIEQNSLAAAVTMVSAPVNVGLAAVFLGMAWVLAFSLVNLSLAIVCMFVHPVLTAGMVGAAFIPLLYLTVVPILMVVMRNKDVSDVLQRERDSRVSTERYEAVMDNLCEGIWEFNFENETAFYSDMWLKLRNVSLDDSEDAFALWWSTIVPEDISIVNEHLSHSFENQMQDVELTYRVSLQGGPHRYMRNHCHIIYGAHNQPARIVGVELDETEIVKFRTRLTAMVEEKTIALERALDSERKITQGQIRFLANASHELRTPMAAILASSDILKKYRSRMNEDGVNDRLDRIGEQVKHMTTLLDNMSDINYLHRTGLSIRLHELDRICVSAVNELNEGLSGGDRVVLHLYGDNWEAQLDEKTFRKSLMAVLDNAVKFSPEGTPVMMKCEQSFSHHIIDVVDTGIGFEEAEFDFLVQPFFRGKNATEYKGNGLGLTYAQDAIDAHNGTLEYFNEPAGGARVRITIPKEG